MASAGKNSGFYRQGNEWYCKSSLPSDITLVTDGVNFHLHKFPLISRCGKITKIIEEALSTTSTTDKTFTINLEDFPGGVETFLTIIKFCYGGRVEFTPRNIVILYCAADYLDMTDNFGDDNLLSRSEKFFHKHILQNWKNCIFALQTCEKVIPRAEKLQIVSRCINALSVMVCTDTSLFGWPMRMYGSLQSPGGSILWNGINTGAKIHSTESDWWFEDVSFLCFELFERVIRSMHDKGIKPENLARCVMYYCKKYLPGLGRWEKGKSGISRAADSYKTAPSGADQRVFLESVVNLLPDKKGKSFCRFLLGLLRVASILGVNGKCQDCLERRIGEQLEFATLDGLLIPSYSDSDTLYNTDCVERIIRIFASFEPSGNSIISPSSLDVENSPSYGRWKRVSKLVDNYIAEVASDVNLKPGKLRSLVEALPDFSRTLSDGLYRALDIYFKAHPWLSQQEREHLCNTIDFQKLSIDACAHASQNERLPLRAVFQVLFFEQMQLKKVLHVLDSENAPIAGPLTGQIVRENRVLIVDMERMRSRVGELEQEFAKIKEEMKRMSKSRSYINSPRFFPRGGGCNLLARSSDSRPEVLESATSTPRMSVEKARTSTRHRKSFSLV